MTVHRLPVPDEPDPPGEAPPGFSAVLRSNLPLTPVNWLVYALAAAALRFFADMSLAATALTMVIGIPAAILIASAAEYASPRFLPRAGGAGTDGEADGDG